MVIPMRYGETIQIIRPPKRDRTGDSVGDPIKLIVENVGFAFESSDTKWPLEATDRYVAEATLFLPDGTDIRKGDRVVRVKDSTEWHVVGRPEWNGAVHPQTGRSSGMFTQRVREVG